MAKRGRFFVEVHSGTGGLVQKSGPFQTREQAETVAARQRERIDQAGWNNEVVIREDSALHGYGKIDVTKNFRRERKRAPSSCAPGSFRARKTKNGALITFCCPKGQWDRKRKVCRTSMKLQSIGRPRRRK